MSFKISDFDNVTWLVIMKVTDGHPFVSPGIIDQKVMKIAEKILIVCRDKLESHYKLMSELFHSLAREPADEDEALSICILLGGDTPEKIIDSAIDKLGGIQEIISSVSE